MTPEEREASLMRLIEATQTELSLDDVSFVANTMLKHGQQFVDLYNTTPRPRETTPREAAGHVLRLCRRIAAGES